MFNWVKKLFGAKAKQQNWIAKPKVIVNTVKTTPKKKTVTTPIVIKPSFKSKKDLAKLTKAKLEEIGRTYGIELDKRKKKDVLINELWRAIQKK